MKKLCLSVNSSTVGLMTRFHQGVLTALGLLAFVHCGTAKTKTQVPTPSAPGTSTTTKVGVAGGTVAVGDSVSLQIPPNALSGDVSITVEEVAGSPSGFTLGSKRYRFLPEGITFAAPGVTVKFEQITVAANQNIFWSKAGGVAGYDELPTSACGTSPAGKAYFCANTLHFSEGFLGASTPTNNPPTCDAGLNLCGTECFNWQTSTAHCGNCETSCGGNQTCEAGVCADVPQQISVSVFDNTQIARVSYPYEISFVAHAGADGVWHNLTTATSPAEPIKVYEFETTEDSYQLLVGCVEQWSVRAPSPSRSVFYKHKLSSVTDIRIDCGVPNGPVLPTPSVTVSFDRTGRSEPTGSSVQYEVANSIFAASVGQGAPVELTNPPDAFDLLAVAYDPYDAPVERYAVLRNLASNTTEAVFDDSSENSLFIEPVTHEFRVNTPNRGDQNGTARLSFGSSRGTFAYPLDSDIVGTSGVNELTISSDRFASDSLTVPTDYHQIDIEMQQNDSSFLAWSISTRVGGDTYPSTTPSVTLPEDIQPDVFCGGPDGPESFSPPSLADVSPEGSDNVIFTVEGRNTLNAQVDWNYEIDRETLAATDLSYTLPVVNTAGVEDYDDAYNLFIENANTCRLEVNFTLPNTSVTASASYSTGG